MAEATRSVECLVIGAGAAGLAAAATAASHGVSVMLVDEHHEPGGRYLGARAGAGAPPPAGAALLGEMAAVAGVEQRTGTVAWGLFDDRTVALATPDRSERVHARTLILATGGGAREVPFPGSTLPGVIDAEAALAAAADGSLAGRRVLVAGSGPSLPAMARTLLHRGARVVAVCEAASLRGPWRPGLLLHLDVLQAAARARREVRAAGVPILTGHILRRAIGASEVAAASVSRCDEDWRPVEGPTRTFDADVVVADWGLTPASELARMAGCTHHYAAASDAWLPERTGDLESSVPGVFVIGDAAGGRGPAMGIAEGHLAGVVVAGRLERLAGRAYERERARARGRFLHLDGLRRALEGIHRVGAGLHDLADDTSVLCRCEGIPVGEARRAAADGVTDVNELKARTRAGMGRCQGRLCASALAHVVARATGRALSEVGTLTPRPPVRPVLLGALAGEEI